jgi:hypothetical protein
MSIEKRLEDHFGKFPEKDILAKVTVLALSHDGRVYGQLGVKKSPADIQSLGALLVGMWQASEAVKGFMDTSPNDDLNLAFQSSNGGFFILRPGVKNKNVFWGLLFENETNPGKVKLYFKKLRDHFEAIEILPAKNKEDEGDGSYLFRDITEDEVDKLFSFAGL